jgi:hypothetical protein
MPDVQQCIEETAFAMLDLSPEQRHQLLCEAFDIAMAKHPDVTEIPPAMVAYVAAVYRRVAELERLPRGNA